MDTVNRSRRPTVVLIAIGEVQTHEETQVFIHDLDLFVTVQLLAETLAVLSIGKVCEDDGYSTEWVSGQKPRLIKDGKSIFCKTDNFILLRQYRKRFVLHIAITGLVEKRGENSSWKQHATCFKIIFKFSIRATWRISMQEIGAIHKKPNPKLKKGMKRRMRMTRRQIFLTGYRISKKIWKIQNCTYVAAKSGMQNVNTSQKTGFATSVWEPKWQGPLAEDALAKLYFEQKVW